MATLFEVPQFFDNNGVPLSAGHVYWYAAGTTTPKQTWKDAAETQPHVLAYITLDANGRWPGSACFIRGSYKIVVKDSTEATTFFTIDNITEYNQFDFTGLTASIADLNSTTTTGTIVSGTYNVTLATRGKTLLANATSANVTINLPSVSTVGNTFKIWIKKIDNATNYVNIIPFGTDLIDFSSNATLWDYNDFIEVRSDGNRWYLGSALIRGTVTNLDDDYTVLLNDNGKLFNCDNSGGAIAITLPSCSVAGRGFSVAFKKIDSSILNATTITPSGSQKIDGVGNYTLSTQWQYVVFKTDGSNWFINCPTLSSLGIYDTGMIMPTFKNYGVSPPSGWIVGTSGGTIGNASSNATNRANNDTSALFTLIWTYMANNCQIYDSAGAPTTRGSSAANDFAANKAIAIPKMTGRCLIGAGISDATNATTTWTINGHSGLTQQYGGDENHTLSIAEMPAHNHGTNCITPYIVDGGQSGDATKGSGSLLWTPLIIANAGGGTSFSLMNPVSTVYYLIKL